MEENKNNKFYVVMTDNSFRPVNDKIKKIMYECDSMAEALKVKTHFLYDQTKSNINIRTGKQLFNYSIYDVEVITHETHGSLYK